MAKVDKTPSGRIAAGGLSLKRPFLGGLNVNTKVSQSPVYDVVLDLGKNVTTIESGLSKETAEATKAAAMKMFLGIRIVERIYTGSRPRPRRGAARNFA